MSGLVSILIPAYNAEEWIRDTIRSALNQTWPRKEIIIVDDGSRDRTLQIAREFESASVKVISQENRGSCAARNKALEFAQGDYIQWLDADDLLAPDKIAQQLKDSKDGLRSRVLYTSAWALFFFNHRKAKFAPDSLWKDLSPVDWILTKFTDSVWMNPATWLVSRRLTDLAKLWDERLSLNDDGEYMCRLVAASEKVKFVLEAKCYHRIANLNSLSLQKSTDTALESQLLSLKLCIECLLSMEDSERTRAASLHHLQENFYLFYPERHDLLKKINRLAQQLGGKLNPPVFIWKYYLIEKIFGYRVAKNFMLKARKTKFIAIRNWHKFAFRLRNELCRKIS